MDRKKTEELILAKTKIKENKKYINCSEAIGIANTLNIAPIEVGKLCNELGIKIQNCQLGCF
ncbi:MAG: hypothetical protein ABSG68_27150 [Thermoguttaceae bacterium]|jgi:hypothetical protein